MCRRDGNTPDDTVGPCIDGRTGRHGTKMGRKWFQKTSGGRVVGRKLIAGNWKMNGTRADAGALIAGILAEAGSLPAVCDLLVCPPFTLIGEVGAGLDGHAVALGGQDCHGAPKGAHTGDISAPMLADMGCRYVIVGHSERRQNHRESSAQVAEKAGAALAAGLTPIVCIGETEAERTAGQTFDVLAAQLDGSIPATCQDGGEVVVAYEPVWAIGTGKTATPADVQAAHRHIRERLQGRFAGSGEATRILYGGSVKPGNAGELMAVANVDGALVGGASLDAASFLGIARASVA
jgi:triosephosphate isomerase